MTVIIDKDKKIKLFAWRQGILDQNNNLPLQPMNISLYGTLYYDTYINGYNYAVGKKWYVVSLDTDNKIKSWYIDNSPEINEWSNRKEKASQYNTETDAEKIVFNLSNSLGRGHYTHIFQ